MREVEVQKVLRDTMIHLEVGSGHFARSLTLLAGSLSHSPSLSLSFPLAAPSPLPLDPSGFYTPHNPLTAPRA